MRYHINFIKLLVVMLTWWRFQVLIQGKNVQTDNTVKVAYQGCLYSQNTFSSVRYNLAPAPRHLEHPCLAPGWNLEDFNGLSPTVMDTITQARIPFITPLFKVGPCLEMESIH